VELVESLVVQVAPVRQRQLSTSALFAIGILQLLMAILGSKFQLLKQ
jgi:hypothetical protein